MKNIIAIFVLSLLFLSCKHTIKLTRVLKSDSIKFKEIENNVLNFQNSYPNSSNQAYNEIYSVKFKLPKDSISLYRNNFERHFLKFKLNFKEFYKNFPNKENIDGFRIHEAVEIYQNEKINDDKEYKGLNYLTYTFKPTQKDTIDYLEEVYIIENFKFDLRDFRKRKEERTFHLTCSPHCPTKTIGSN